MPPEPEIPAEPGNAAVRGEYVYEVVDNDGAPLGRLPLACDDFTNTLTSNGGLLNATLARSDVHADPGFIDPPGRELVVSRNGQVVWNGPITYRHRSRREPLITLRAYELTWYLYNARLEEDFSRTDTDVFDIVRDLVDIALGKTGGERFAFSVTAGLAGITKTVDYLGAYRYSIGQLIEDLATDPIDGFDFRMTYSGTCAADLSRLLELGAPSLGTTIEGRKLQPGGGLLDLVDECSIERGGNRTHLLPGIGPTLTRTNDTSLAAGDPSIEYVLNRPDLDSDQAPASGIADDLRRLAQPPVRPFTAYYTPRGDLPYGWCRQGDTVAIADPDFAIDDTRRVTAITTQPPKPERPEQVALSLNLPLDELGD